MRHLLLLTALTLVACNDTRPVPQLPVQQPQQVYQDFQGYQPTPQQSYQQPVQAAPTYYPPTQAPVIVQQPQQSHSGVTDMLVGGLIGHAVGNAMNGSNRANVQQPQVINRTIINRTYVNRPSVSYSRPTNSRTLRR